MLAYRIENKFDHKGPFRTSGDTSAFLKDEFNRIDENSHMEIGEMLSVNKKLYNHLSLGNHLFFFNNIKRLFTVFEVINKKAFLNNWDVIVVILNKIPDHSFYILDDDQIVIEKEIVVDNSFELDYNNYSEFI